MLLRPPCAYIISLLFAVGCVSVSLGSKNTRSYKKIVVPKLPDFFVELPVEAADQSWQNSKNGNTISYMSTCDHSSDPTLEVLQSMALDGIEDLKIIEKKKIIYNGREALKTQLLGRVDGVPIQADLTVLKKNNCIFNITYIGSIHTFINDLEIFNKFWGEFKIQ